MSTGADPEKRGNPVSNGGPDALVPGVGGPFGPFGGRVPRYWFGEGGTGHASAPLGWRHSSYRALSGRRYG